MRMTDNLGRARHSVRAASCQSTRSAGRGLPALPVSPPSNLRKSAQSAEKPSPPSCLGGKTTKTPSHQDFSETSEICINYGKTSLRLRASALKIPLQMLRTRNIYRSFTLSAFGGEGRGEVESFKTH